MLERKLDSFEVQKEWCFFFTLFNGLSCYVDENGVIIKTDSVDDFRQLMSMLLVRYRLGQIQDYLGADGSVFKGAPVTFNVPELFDKIVVFWLRCFSAGHYVIKGESDFRTFRAHLYEMGVQCSYGPRFADQYKAYVALLAQWLNVSPRSIKAALMGEVKSQKTLCKAKKLSPQGTESQDDPHDKQTSEDE